jgi:hypothetical protein
MVARVADAVGSVSIKSYLVLEITGVDYDKIPLLQNWREVVD